MKKMKIKHQGVEKYMNIFLNNNDIKKNKKK